MSSPSSVRQNFYGNYKQNANYLLCLAEKDCKAAITEQLTFAEKLSGKFVAQLNVVLIYTTTISVRIGVWLSRNWKL